MKNENRLVRILIEKKLSVKEQKEWRLKLRELKEKDGIESICIEDNEVFIEYAIYKQDIESIHRELRELKFPCKNIMLEPML